ncbi:MAG: SDR family NAD(P)-dependent oxidoreductase [Bacteroidota bacterium]
MKNAKILITGASRGIGQAIALKLSQEGFSLVLHARQDESLIETISQLKEGIAYETITADLADPNQVKGFLSALKKAHKDLYGIVSNAGITSDKPIAYQPEKEIDLLLQVNLKVPILLGKYAMKHFMKTKKGFFVNISSVVGEIGNAFQSVYGASKAGITALSKSWAKEIGQLVPDHEVRFLTVSPGFIETDMTDQLTPAIKSLYKKSIPSNRFGHPGEVANLIAFLLSEQSPYINGSEIKINGGIA